MGEEAAAAAAMAAPLQEKTPPCGIAKGCALGLSRLRDCFLGVGGHRKPPAEDGATENLQSMEFQKNDHQDQGTGGTGGIKNRIKGLIRLIS
ncbi:hypothetical protein BRADI_3g15796v3 [Brachypodium distachyon]|uniref:Uncharacterized protein n=1 Tax=Brachypodium distachyon TaxID=15368 RepID=A0A0Q3Q0M8_BRADI|nr:hypothetical protein BRADI_3g15796v3 [Brachypodium distachyon]